MRIPSCLLSLLGLILTAPLATAQTADVIGEVGGLLGQLGAPQPGFPPLDRLKMDAVWGKPLGGLQAGIRPTPDATLTFDIIVRNVGKEPIAFSHLNLAFGGDNLDGTVTAKAVEVAGQFTPKGKRFTAKLAPGETRSLGLLPALAPGAANADRPAATLQRGSNHLGAEAIPVRLDSGKDLELATGYLDVSWPSARK